MLKVVGLGNELRGDDGVGPRILELLTDIKHPIPIKFIHAGADAFILLEHLVDSEPLIVLDCARMGQPPGTVRKFEISEANLQCVTEAIALHGFSFAEIVEMARKVGPIAPCSVVGIEPLQTEMNTPLSIKVEQSIPKAIALVKEEIGKYANRKSVNN